MIVQCIVSIYHHVSSRVYHKQDKHISHEIARCIIGSLFCRLIGTTPFGNSKALGAARSMCKNQHPTLGWSYHAGILRDTWLDTTFGGASTDLVSNLGRLKTATWEAKKLPVCHLWRHSTAICPFAITHNQLMCLWIAWNPHVKLSELGVVPGESRWCPDSSPQGCVKDLIWQYKGMAASRHQGPGSAGEMLQNIVANGNVGLHCLTAREDAYRQFLFRCHQDPGLAYQMSSESSEQDSENPLCGLHQGCFRWYFTDKTFGICSRWRFLWCLAMGWLDVLRCSKDVPLPVRISENSEVHLDPCWSS